MARFPAVVLFGWGGRALNDSHINSTNSRILPELFPRAHWDLLVVRFGLSERQRDIARLICRGHTNNEISRRLGISFDTARMHTRVLYSKLKVRCRVGVPVRLVLAVAELVR